MAAYFVATRAETKKLIEQLQATRGASQPEYFLAINSIEETCNRAIHYAIEQMYRTQAIVQHERNREATKQ
ncbi:MAG: hypothetical protein ACRDAM_15930 [Casimicrobium sp.]